MIESRDEFERMLQRMNESPAVPAALKRRAIEIHDDLMVARAIAVSLFEKRWTEHVWSVYDRLVARQPQPQPEGTDGDR